MTNTANAEIIAIGTEILLGEITDTNSVYMARVLRDIGVNLYFMTSVGDNEARIADAIRIALSRANIVITCGGLGPTVDDMTRQGVARATERGLTFHQPLLDAIAERFAGFRVQMTENNRRQAFLPDDAVLIENPVGTAPSFIVEHGGGVVISLPGVPREMKFLFHERVVPFLRERFNLGEDVIKAKVFKTAGIGESMLDEAIGTDLLEAANPTVGLAAHSGQVDVRVTAKADSTVRADEMIAAVELILRERVGAYIFGADDDTIEGALAAVLVTHGHRVAFSETGNGAALSERLRAVDAECIAASIVHTSPADLRAALSVADDVPLRVLAEQAAQNAAALHGAAVGVAVVSLPDVDENADVVEGSAVAVVTPHGVRSRAYGFGGRSAVGQAWTSTWALAMAWRMMTERGGDED